MTEGSGERHSHESTYVRAQRLLSERLKASVSEDVEFIEGDGHSHTVDFRDNLLPVFSDDQVLAVRRFLEGGSGGELRAGRSGKTSAHAAYSSAALAANAFGPWLGSEDRLPVAKLGGFEAPLELEAKLKISHGGGLANLDVLLRGEDGVVGIESKLIETLRPHPSESWRDPYRAEAMSELLDGPWRAVLDESLEGREQTRYLGTAQLIKHALALRSRFPDEVRRHLVYIYWEPSDGDASPEVAVHRDEVRRLAEALEGSDPSFLPISYPRLFEEWEGVARPDHLRQLRDRYELALR